MTEFRLLGPFAGPVDLPGGKPRALLARLLLDNGRVVSAATLVDSLWDDPPPSAPKTLQAHVSALRKVLGPAAIETRASGYALLGATSDLGRFEELAWRARGEVSPARRAALLRDALALWRGEPLAEFRREPFAPQAAARLAELRLDAVTRRIDAELELGEHEQLVRELTSLVADEPLREYPRRQLMLALYRSGRQADALTVYRDGRRVLVEELGIEPGSSLQELERAILRHDPALDLARPTQPLRGPIVCAGVAPVSLLAPLGRELLLVELVGRAEDLPAAASRLQHARGGRAEVRTASFTSSDSVSDLLRLTVEQGAELLVVGAATGALLAGALCDVAVSNGVAGIAAGAVLVPFSGARDEWAALELGAWLSKAHDRPLRLLGIEATEGRRDASRTLAAASLALQRFAGVTAEATLVPAGAAGILAEAGAAVVASLPAGVLDPVRAELLRAAAVPVLLVHGGLRPGGLATGRTLTRFSWSLAPA